MLDEIYMTAVLCREPSIAQYGMHLKTDDATQITLLAISIVIV